MGKIKVLLCGDFSSYSQSLADAFENESAYFEVVGIVVLQKLEEAALRSRADILLIKLDEVNYLPIILNLKKKCPFLLPVLIVNEYVGDTFELMKMGIFGCLPLRLFPRQIVNAVELIATAGVACLPRLESNIIVKGNRELDQAIFKTLTNREREVLNFLGRNYSNKEIADYLCLSESTIKTHLGNIFRKLDVSNRTEAADLLEAYGDISVGRFMYTFGAAAEE